MGAGARVKEGAEGEGTRVREGVETMRKERQELIAGRKDGGTEAGRGGNYPILPEYRATAQYIGC